MPGIESGISNFDSPKVLITGAGLLPDETARNGSGNPEDVIFREEKIDIFKNEEQLVQLRAELKEKGFVTQKGEAVKTGVNEAATILREINNGRTLRDFISKSGKILAGTALNQRIKSIESGKFDIRKEKEDDALLNKKLSLIWDGRKPEELPGWGQGIRTNQPVPLPEKINQRSAKNSKETVRQIKKKLKRFVNPESKLSYLTGMAAGTLQQFLAKEALKSMPMLTYEDRLMLANTFQAATAIAAVGGNLVIGKLQNKSDLFKRLENKIKIEDIINGYILSRAVVAASRNFGAEHPEIGERILGFVKGIFNGDGGEVTGETGFIKNDIFPMDFPEADAPGSHAISDRHDFIEHNPATAQPEKSHVRPGIAAVAEENFLGKANVADGGNKGIIFESNPSDQNGEKFDEIVPVAEPEAAENTGNFGEYEEYIVKNGDTLGQIGLEHGWKDPYGHNMTQTIVRNMTELISDENAEAISEVVKNPGMAARIGGKVTRFWETIMAAARYIRPGQKLLIPVGEGK